MKSFQSDLDKIAWSYIVLLRLDLGGKTTIFIKLMLDMTMETIPTDVFM